jgi:2-methylcitrate dehydratase
VLDTLGVMCAARDSAAPRIARTYAQLLPVPGGATVFAAPAAATPDTAGFANGVHARYLDFNDTYLSLEPLHPSDVIMPLLALAEWHGAEGKRLIEAIAVAYEVGMNLCDAASLRAHGWDHVNYIGLGVAAGASRLLRLSAAQSAHALSIAQVPHAAMRQTRAGELSMWKGAAAANAARNGLFAALLAAQGFTGPYDAFTGSMGMFAQMLDGGTFADGALASMRRVKPPQRICDAYIKAYPVEYHAQSAVDAACALHDEIGDWSQIERVEVDTFKAAYEIIVGDPEKWAPRTRETADHSLQYIIAAALADGEITRESFGPERLKDERIRTLLSRMTVTESDRLSALYPESIPVTIRVRAAGGREYTQQARYPLGHAGNKMTDGQVVAKFERNRRGVLTDAEAARVIESAWRMDEWASPREFTALWPRA